MGSRVLLSDCQHGAEADVVWEGCGGCSPEECPRDILQSLRRFLQGECCGLVQRLEACPCSLGLLLRSYPVNSVLCLGDADVFEACGAFDELSAFPCQAIGKKPFVRILLL